jgi:hypothetical protein
VRHLGALLSLQGKRRLQVLLETGKSGASKGARPEAVILAGDRQGDQGGRSLQLRRVKCFEGILPDVSEQPIEDNVRALYDAVVAATETIDRLGLFGRRPDHLSGGG